MRTQLKKYRVRATMTQAGIAKAVGVTQPTYQRWEAGLAEVPEAKLKKLSRILRATPDEMLGRHPPIRAAFYDPEASDELSYYGEVAIHFRSGGPSLLLSISEAELSSLHRDLQSDKDFVTVKSLANQTVVLRKKAVDDLYFCSEAYDTFGPEHASIREQFIPLQLPDGRDWAIITALAAGDAGLEDFDAEDVERVRQAVMITDEQYEKLVAGGQIKPENLESEKAKNDKETQKVFELATHLVYQLSTGKRRSVSGYDPGELYDSFCWLMDFADGTDPDEMIRFEADGRHRILFINKQALDFVSIPTHLYEESEIQATERDLELDEVS